MELLFLSSFSFFLPNTWKQHLFLTIFYSKLILWWLIHDPLLFPLLSNFSQTFASDDFREHWSLWPLDNILDQYILSMHENRQRSTGFLSILAMCAFVRELMCVHSLKKVFLWGISMWQSLELLIPLLTP